MPVNTEAVGASADHIQWRASARRGLAFTAALSLDRAALFADEAEGYALLPMTVVTPEWQAALALRGMAVLGLRHDEHVRVVHAGQDTRFHALMRPGQEVLTSAVVTGVRTVSSGALVQTLFTTSVADSGAVIAETVSHSVYRGVEVRGNGVAGPAPTRSSTPDIEMSHTAHYALPRGFAHLYSEAADIWNPIHTERRVAQAAGLDDCIVHGTALWALAGGVVVETHAGGAYNQLKRLSCRFASVVNAGEAISIRHGAIGAHARFAIDAGAGDCVTHGIAEFAS